MSAGGERASAAELSPRMRRPRPGRAGRCAAAVAIVGWVTGDDELTRFGPGLAADEVQHRLRRCCSSRPPGSSRRARARGAGRRAALGGGVARRAQLRRRLRIDNLVVGLRPDLGRHRAAACWCVGLALAQPRSRPVTPGRLAAEAVLVLGSFELFGYLYGARSLYAVGAFASVSLHAAITLALLSLAVMVEAPGSALWWILRGRDVGASIMRKVVPAVLIVVPVVGYLAAAR